MGKFLEYLLEAENEEKDDNSGKIRYWSSDKTFSIDTGNEYLDICLKWLMSFDFSVGISLKEEPRQAEIIARGKHAGKIKNNRINLFSKDFENKKRQMEGQTVLDSFKNGPLFLKSKNQNEVVFLWYSDESNISTAVKKVQKTKSKAIKYVVNKFSRDIKSEIRSAASHYLFGCYVITARKQDIEKEFGKGKTIKTEDLQQIEIMPKVVVDFTVKNGSDESTKIRNAEDILRIVENPLKAETKNGYITIESKSVAKFKENEISKSIDGSSKLLNLDKKFYRSIFKEIFSKDVPTDKVFDIVDSFKNPIDKETDEKIADIISNYAWYGSILSELLIPFLLLKGYKSIKTSDGKTVKLLQFRNEEDEKQAEVQSIEFPVSSRAVLADYNVVFVNTNKGRFAISAKFTDNSNAPSLFGLLKKKEDGDKYFEKKKDTLLADIYTIVKNNPPNKSVAKNLLESLAAVFKKEDKSKIANELDSKAKELAMSEKNRNVEEIYKDIVAVIKSEYEKSQSNKKEESNVPFLIIGDRLLSDKLEQNNEFLLELYQFMFSYFKDTEFSQIQLDKDLKVHIIRKEKSVTEKNVDKFILVYSTAGYLKGKIFVPQPCHVKLLHK